MEDETKTKEDSAPKFVYSAFTAAAWIILIHELLERFSFYGMKAILTYYLSDYLGFDDDTATIIYHLFTGISYVTPLLGTYLSDNFFGRYKTIIILGVVYLVGHAAMPLTALVNNRPGPIIAMFVLAVGTGGIKPCVAAFGGDQVEPGQEIVLDAFFSVFYMCINIGAFASQLLTPILREQVKCIDDACYPLAFGVPAIVFGLSYVLFLAGTPKYKRYPKPNSPMLNKAIQVIVAGKLKEGAELSDEPTDDGLTEREFIGDVRQSLRVCFLFLPFPIYWALFDQQGSRWVLQGKRMDGYISEGLSLTADQMQSVNPLLIVLVVPIFNNIVYPLFAKCNLLVSATSRIFVGYLVCAACFGLTGFLELLVDARVPVAPNHGMTDLQLFNANNCSIQVTITKSGMSHTIPAFHSHKMLVDSSGNQSSLFSFDAGCSNGSNNNKARPQIRPPHPPHSQSYLVVMRGDQCSSGLQVPFDVSDTRIRYVHVGSLKHFNWSYPHVQFGHSDQSCKPGSNLTHSFWFGATNYCEIPLRTSVPFYLNHKKIQDISLTGPGTIKYVTVIGVTDQHGNVHLHRSVDREVNPLHILLQLPQYLLMCISEVLFSVTALAFAYSEAPDSLKSLLQSAYLVSIFFGNMIVIGVAAAPKLPRQAFEFFLFAGLVFIGGFVQLFVIRIYNQMKTGSGKVHPIEIPMKDLDDASSSGVSDEQNNNKDENDL